jgi:predicted DNA-binding protein with PD1-like motif
VKHQRTHYGYALRIDPGEEIIGALTGFATGENVRGGLISGIGAVGEAELGFYKPATGVYERRQLRGDFEILALTGNYSDLEGQPFPHCHVILAGEDFATQGGHLFRGVVSVTCEAHIVIDGGVIRRVRRPGQTFMPLEPGD